MNVAMVNKIIETHGLKKQMCDAFLGKQARNTWSGVTAATSRGQPEFTVVFLDIILSAEEGDECAEEERSRPGEWFQSRSTNFSVHKDDVESAVLGKFALALKALKEVPAKKV
jgi:hypothetical protein